MDKSVEEFLAKLQSVSMAAEQDGISIQAAYKRIRTGNYRTINICGTRFILRDE